MRANVVLVVVPALLGVALAAPPALAKDVPIDILLHELEGGTLHLLPPEINAEVGHTLRLNVVNQGQNPHNIVVCGEPAKPQATCDNVLGQTQMLQAEQSELLVIDLERPGTFDYYSSIFGEKQAGMRGTLRVTGEAPSQGIPFAGPALLLVTLAGAVVLARRLRS